MLRVRMGVWDQPYSLHLGTRLLVMEIPARLSDFCVPSRTLLSIPFLCTSSCHVGFSTYFYGQKQSKFRLSSLKVKALRSVFPSSPVSGAAFALAFQIFTSDHADLFSPKVRAWTYASHVMFAVVLPIPNVPMGQRACSAAVAGEHTGAMK